MDSTKFRFNGCCFDATPGSILREINEVVCQSKGSGVKQKGQADPAKISKTNIKTQTYSPYCPGGPLSPLFLGSQQRGALGGVVHCGEVSAVHVPVLPPRLVRGVWDTGVPVVHVVGHEQGQLQNLGPDFSSVNQL